jgi:hypothetical protein
MMLREIMVTKCADRGLHTLAANSTNSAGNSLSVVSCSLSIKRGITFQNTAIISFSSSLFLLETDFNLLLKEYLTRDSSVGIATAYGLDDRGSIPSRGKIFSTPQRLD